MTAPVQRTSVEGALGGQSTRLGDLEAVPTFAQYEIKVSQDLDVDATAEALTTNNTFIFCVPRDLDGARFLDIQAFVTTVGGSLISIQLTNTTTTGNMLFQEVEIDSGELTSFTAATQPEIDIDEDIVTVGDLLQIVVTSDGGGTAYGLGVILKFTVTFPGA